jgi:uncharacterized pyridoxal phosphate-containing UPF0001 family protein
MAELAGTIAQYLKNKTPDQQRRILAKIAAQAEEEGKMKQAQEQSKVNDLGEMELSELDQKIRNLQRQPSVDWNQVKRLQKAQAKKLNQTSLDMQAAREAAAKPLQDEQAQATSRKRNILESELAQLCKNPSANFKEIRSVNKRLAKLR